MRLAMNVGRPNPNSACAVRDYPATPEELLAVIRAKAWRRGCAAL